jgi:hypothetical protein
VMSTFELDTPTSRKPRAMCQRPQSATNGAMKAREAAREVPARCAVSRSIAKDRSPRGRRESRTKKKPRQAQPEQHRLTSDFLSPDSKAPSDPRLRHPSALIRHGRNRLRCLQAATSSDPRRRKVSPRWPAGEWTARTGVTGRTWESPAIYTDSTSRSRVVAPLGGEPLPSEGDWGATGFGPGAERGGAEGGGVYLRNCSSTQASHSRSGIA